MMREENAGTRYAAGSSTAPTNSGAPSGEMIANRNGLSQTKSRCASGAIGIAMTETPAIV